MEHYSSTNEENDYDTGEDDDKGFEVSRHELPMQTPPQTPNNIRSRNIHIDKHNATPGIMANTNPNMTKDEAIKILAVNLDHSIR